MVIMFKPEEVLTESLKEQLFRKRFGALALTEVVFHLIFLPEKPENRSIMEKYPDFQKANGLLGLICLDHVEGLNIEIISNARLDRTRYGNRFSFFSPDLSAHETIHFDQVTGDDFLIFPYHQDLVSEQAARQIADLIRRYQTAETLVFTRAISSIDYLRNMNYPDEFVLFMMDEKGGYEPVWARLEYCTPNGVLLASIPSDEMNSDKENPQPISVTLLKLNDEPYERFIPVHFHNHQYSADMLDFMRARKILDEDDDLPF